MENHNETMNNGKTTRQRLLALTILVGLMVAVGAWQIYSIKTTPPITYDEHNDMLRRLAGVEQLEATVEYLDARLKAIETRLDEQTTTDPGVPDAKRNNSPANVASSGPHRQPPRKQWRSRPIVEDSQAFARPVAKRQQSGRLLPD